jgi:hypothetical protein
MSGPHEASDDAAALDPPRASPARGVRLRIALAAAAHLAVLGLPAHAARASVFDDAVTEIEQTAALRALQGSGVGVGHLGHGAPRLLRRRKAKLWPDELNPIVPGLPPGYPQRVIRRNLGRLRFCYEQGQRADPNLQGRVTVRFTIRHDGGVASVTNGGSDLPDATVVSCILRVFSGLSFPQTERGPVTISYPMVFSPGA